MVSLLSALLISSVQYFPPAGAPSCGLLHHRELERAKVMREFESMMKSALNKDERALVPLDCLLTNKLFMPKDTWFDDSVEVAVVAKISDEMRAEIQRIGLQHVFIRIDAPGFVWQSLAGQLPEEVSIIEDPNGVDLDIRYKTYLNSTCEQPLRDPIVEWVPHDNVPDVVNSWDVVTKVHYQKVVPTFSTF